MAKIDTFYLIFCLKASLIRFDQSVLHEFLHKSEYLQSRCGPFDPNTGSPFRQVLTYSASVDGGALEDDAMSNQVIGELKEILIPAVLKVFGETDNVEAKMATKMFSIYTNLLFPGNVVKVHLDVPQFIGLDRFGIQKIKVKKYLFLIKIHMS